MCAGNETASSWSALALRIDYTVWSRKTSVAGTLCCWLYFTITSSQEECKANQSLHTDSLSSVIINKESCCYCSLSSSTANWMAQSCNLQLQNMLVTLTWHCNVRQLISCSRLGQHAYHRREFLKLDSLLTVQYFDIALYPCVSNGVKQRTAWESELVAEIFPLHLCEIDKLIYWLL